MRLTNAGDEQLIQELRQRKRATIRELCAATGVTVTAVRQRLLRLTAAGFVERTELRSGRGRPVHVFSVAPAAESQLGSNYPDLVLAMWSAIKELEDPQIRRELGRRVRDLLVTEYRSRLHGDTAPQRLDSLCGLMESRGVRMEVDNRGPLPILREHNCPYPELAAVDRGICALEKQVFDRVLGFGVKLTQCQMFGHSCCEFRVPAALTVDRDSPAPRNPRRSIPPVPETVADNEPN